MLETETEASHYFDGWITEHFSDLALLSELQHSVDALAPWFDKNKAARFTSQADQLVSRTRGLTAKLHGAIPLVCDELTIAWDHAYTASFDYPAEKAPTKANVDQMRSAERCLDKFWSQVQKRVSSMVKISLEKVLFNRMFESRQLYRTPPWQKPVQPPTPECTPPKTTVTADPPSATLQHTSAGSQESAEVTLTRGKQKIKTRGQPAAPDPRMIIADDAVVAQHRVKLPKEVHKVFCALLPSTVDVAQQRFEIGWEEMLFAFDHIGLEPEQLHGSAWIFRPRPREECKVELRRSIQFHEPKELRRGAKIPRPMVRLYGRRLKHAYGWTCAEDLFESE